MNAPGEVCLRTTGFAKTFVLHPQGGARIPVVAGVDLAVAAGECVALTGPSGSGKSTLLRALYANYLPSAGAVEVRHAGAWIDLGAANPRDALAVRRHTIGYVSQFLRVIPRVPSLELVVEPMIEAGDEEAPARERARSLLERLNLPPALWSLPPATFSGGEQQRVNIARGMAHPYPVLLLDEPTASLDPVNRDVVVALIGEARARGAAIVVIFHDADVREAVATREFDVSRYRAAA